MYPQFPEAVTAVTVPRWRCLPSHASTGVLSPITNVPDLVSKRKGRSSSVPTHGCQSVSLRESM